MPWLSTSGEEQARIARAPWRWWTAFLAAFCVFAVAAVVPFAAATLYAIATSATVMDADPDLLLARMADSGVLAAALLGHQAMVALGIGGLAAYGAGTFSDVLMLRRPKLDLRLALAAAALLAAFFAVDWVLARAFPDALAGDAEAVTRMLRSDYMALTIALAVVGAPIAEEFLFRGFLYPAFARSRLGFSGAAIVTSAMWSAIHGYSWAGSLEIFLFGLGLCWILRRTESLWIPIGLHAAVNAYFTVMTLWVPA